MNRKKREQLILSAAIRVFHREGYDNTSVSQIIDEAQVARGTFYLYFKSKKEVLALLLDRLFNEVMVGVKAFEANGSIREKSSPLISALTRDSLLMQLILFSSHTLDQEFQAQIKQFEDQLVSNLAAFLKTGMDKGDFRSLASTDLTARCFVGSVKEILSSWVRSGATEMEPVIEALIDHLMASVKQPDMVSETMVAGSLVSNSSANFH